MTSSDTDGTHLINGRNPLTANRKTNGPCTTCDSWRRTTLLCRNVRIHMSPFSLCTLYAYLTGYHSTCPAALLPRCTATARLRYATGTLTSHRSTSSLSTNGLHFLFGPATNATSTYTSSSRARGLPSKGTSCLAAKLLFDTL